MNLVINWVVSGLAIVITSYLLPGVHTVSFTSALIVAIVLGIINAIIRPILLILTLPINIVTLGLFTFVINALLIMLTARIVPGFRVDGFWWALLFSVVLFLVNWFFHRLS